jgi:hypothetical protein
MIRLTLRCSPVAGAVDLGWLARLTGALDAIYVFSLRAGIADQAGRSRDLTLDELALVVDGRAAEQGSPAVHLRDGPVVIELGVRLVGSTLPAQALAVVALLFAEGPTAAAWPTHVRAAWHGPGTVAEAARQAYEWIATTTTVEVEDGGRGGKRDRPSPRRKGKGAKGRARAVDSPTELAGSARFAPPLRE